MPLKFGQLSSRVHGSGSPGMIGETLEITIVVSMIVLIAYPSGIALRQALLERRQRRVKVAERSAKKGQRQKGVL